MQNKLPALLTDPWFDTHFIAYAKEDGSFRIRNEDGTPYTFQQSQGLRFWCPCGYGTVDKNGEELFPLDLSHNKGRPHACIIVFKCPPCGIVTPENFGPSSRQMNNIHPRWSIVGGTGLHDLSLTPSIAIGDPECWHGYITDGKFTNC